MKKIIGYIKLIRLKHWIKNILIAVPVFFAGKIWKLDNIISLLYGFISFGFVSSIVYILNDIQDVDKDRKHEIKKNRPIASGLISIREGQVLIVILTFIIMCINFALYKRIQSLSFLIWEVIYLILNILYSVKLKRIPIIDIMILTVGFIIRIYYGSAICLIAPSSWLLLTVLSFALYMGTGKRRNELDKVGNGSTRDVLQFYTKELLDRYMLIAETLGIVFYSLWVASVIKKHYMIWTVFLVIAIIMKYEMIIKSDSYGDPVEVLLSDKILIAMVVLFVAVMYVFMYVV